MFLEENEITNENIKKCIVDDKPLEKEYEMIFNDFNVDNVLSLIKAKGALEILKRSDYKIDHGCISKLDTMIMEKLKNYS
jgi:hypothetical protein